MIALREKQIKRRGKRRRREREGSQRAIITLVWGLYILKK